jgi:hypothetical protein
MELPEKHRELLINTSKLLNGQIRGTIVAKAKDENLQLIQMTLNNIYQAAYMEGFQDGKSEELEERFKQDIIKDLKKGK